MGRKFEPWRRQRKAGMGALAIGLALAAAAFVAFKSGGTGFGLGLAAASALFFGAGSSSLNKAQARAFGQTFEAEHLELAVRRLSGLGLHCRTNVMRAGCGDIDLVVKTEGATIPVEIKSYRKWRQPFFIFHGARERRAIAQARKQMNALKTDAGIIWLPQGSPSLLQRIFGAGAGPVRVVFGGDQRLASELKRFG